MKTLENKDISLVHSMIPLVRNKFQLMAIRRVFYIFFYRGP